MREPPTLENPDPETNHIITVECLEEVLPRARAAKMMLALGRIDEQDEADDDGSETGGESPAAPERSEATQAVEAEVV